MRWYMLLHLSNLYVLPAVGYMYMVRKYSVVDIADYGMGILFFYIPLGCFLISFVYGLRKRTYIFVYCFVCSFLCIPLTFPDIVSGDGILNHVWGGIFMYFSYFAIALMGSIAGIICYLCYMKIKKIIHDML